MIEMNSESAPWGSAPWGLLVAVVFVVPLFLTACSAGGAGASGAAVATASVSAAPPASSGAAPSASVSPVSVDELGAGSQPGPVDVEVPGPVTVTFRTITLEPGAGTGKHCHYGQLIAVVKSGTLTHYAPIYPGGARVYEAGSSLIEGEGYVHEGRNEGTVPVVLDVTYVIPEGDVLAETDLTHCDPQAQ